MILNNNLIAYEYYKNQFVPKEVYPSGERDETKLIDKYSFNNQNLPILVLEQDIVNKDGYGLKKGFYNIFHDKYLDFLLIYQSGKLKAKVPIINSKVFETINPETTQKPKKMSYSKYLKNEQKNYRKYLKGENPLEVEYQEVKTIYSKEENALLIIYTYNNLELTGIIKL